MLARTSATRVASLMYLTPPVTTAWAFAMFGEPITPAGSAGLVICLAGVWLARRRRDPTPALQHAPCRICEA